MKYKKSKRYYYFRKQRCYGLAFILLGILTAIILGGDITVSILLVPLGIYIMLTKEMLITDDYYFEVKEKRNGRH